MEGLRGREHRMNETAIHTREALLEHGSFVKALARRLARDACEAEDLEQDVWLAALQGRMAGDDDLRGWLARRLRTRAGNRRRAERNRRQRERAVARKREDDPGSASAEAVARMELRQRIVEAVLDLEEPFRTTVLLRYDHDRTPTAIARELDVSVSTVKSRLRRAMERLRERLDREAGGNGRTWLPSLLLFLDESPPAKPSLSSTAVLAGVAAVVLTALFAGWQIRRGLAPVDEAETPLVAETVESTPAGSSGSIPARATAGPDPRSPLAGAEDPAVGEEIVVRVVDAWTRRPVEGAELSCATASGEYPHGPSARTDAEGLATIPLADQPTSVRARHGERQAVVYLERTDLGPFEIGIQRTRSLSVLVVDAGGVPAAGIGVALTYQRSRTSFRSTGATTGPDGIAEFELEEIQEGTLPGTRWEVQPRMLGASPPAVSLDPREPRAGPVRLQLPPTGRILVRLVDEDGRSVDEPTLVFARPGVGRVAHPSINELIEGGRATIPFVEPGRRFEFRVPRGMGRGMTEVEADGPSEPGETATVTITLPDDGTRLVGRFVDERGEPLGDRELTYHRGVPHRSHNAQPGRTDRDGNFALVLSRPQESEEIRLVSVLATPVVGDSVRLGCVELPEDLADGPADVGDVPLHAPSSFVRGRVVDGEGRGVPCARIELSRHWPLSNDPEELENRKKERSRGFIQMTHEPIHLFGVTADEHGRFELRFEGEGVAHALRASASRYGASRQVPFEPGDDSVVIRLERPGAIVGSLELPGGLPIGQVRVEFGIGTEFAREGHPLPRSILDAGGHFHLRGVPAGVRSVEVTIAGIDGPVARVERVVVEPGVLNADPRLRRIDVSRFVRVFELEIVDEKDEPIPEGRIQLRASDGEHARIRVVRFLDGSARFTTSARAFRARIQGKGYGATTVHDLSDRARVVLRRALSARLHLSPDVEPPPEFWAIELLLLPPSLASLASDRELLTAELRARGAIPCTLAEDRAVELTLPEPGRWAARWTLKDTQSKRGIAVRPTNFDVLEGGRRQTIELLPEPTSWTMALSRIR